MSGSLHLGFNALKSTTLEGSYRRESSVKRLSVLRSTVLAYSVGESSA